MIITPIVLSLLFTNIFSESKSKTHQPKVGIIASEQNPLLAQLASETAGLRLFFFQTRQELEAQILENEMNFGLILPNRFDVIGADDKRPALTILYPSTLPPFSMERVKAALEGGLRKHLGLPPPPLPIDITMAPVGKTDAEDHSFGSDLFPMLVLMAMGMVGLLGLPLSFVEEKEKRTLYALFLTPTNASDLIIGKSLFSLVLILGTILAMVTLNSRWSGNVVYFWLFALLGALICIFLGLLISLFAKNQASVNAVGTTLFMFFQLIPNLQRASDLMKTLSPLVPSTFIVDGIKKAMFLDLTKVDIQTDLAIVVCWALATYLAVFVCFKYRQTEM